MSGVLEGKEADNADLEAYLTKHQINDLFVRIVEELLLNKPENPIRSIVDYLKRSFGESFANEIVDDRLVDETIEAISDEEEEEDEDDYVDTLKVFKPRADPKHGNRRVSVSAASLDASKLSLGKGAFFKKTEAEKDHLRNVLSGHMLFKELDKKGTTAVLDALEKKKYEADAVIIKEGDKVGVNHFYILDSGKCEVFKGSPAESINVFYNKQGDGFGELALMYNAPRAATIKTCEPTVCWALDRVTFKTIVMNSVITRRQKIVQFLHQVPLLSSLKPNEKKFLADAVAGSVQLVPAGTEILRVGTKGDKFYIVEEGEVECQNAAGDVLLTVDAGGYFGEIALITSKARQATCVAKTDCTLLSMDRKTFQRVMGPLGEILKRNMTHYHAVFKGENH